METNAETLSQKEKRGWIHQPQGVLCSTTLVREKDRTARQARSSLHVPGRVTCLRQDIQVIQVVRATDGETATLQVPLSVKLVKTSE